MPVAKWKHRNGSCRFGLLAAIFIALPAIVLARKLPLKTFTTSDGLARDYINRIVPDSRGFLWFCTPEGLSRFDGYAFTNYGAADGLPGSIWDLLEAQDGAYWIATSSGLYRFDPAATGDIRPQSVNRSALDSSSRRPNFELYHAGKLKESRTVHVVKEDRSGVIWFGTDEGLHRLDRTPNGWNTSLVEIGLPEDQNDRMVSTIVFDRSGSMWIGASSGLYRRSTDGQVWRYTKKFGFPFNDVRALLEDRAGILWVGTTQGLFRVAIPSSRQIVVEKSYMTENGLAQNWITSILQTTDGRLWVGTNRGLTEFSPGPNGKDPAFRTYTTAEGLTANEIQSLVEDSEGELWIGTESGGVMELARKGFVSYSEQDGLSALRIASIFEDDAGELCVLSKQAGELFIQRFDGERFSIVKPNLSEGINFGWGWNQIGFQDHAGEWWLTSDQGLYRFPKFTSVNQLTHERPRNIYTTKDGLPSDQTFRVFEDQRGDVWIGTITPNRNALVRWERDSNSFQVIAAASGVPQFMAPTVFREDASGNLWIGFYEGGLARYVNGQFTRFKIDDGLPEGMVRDLHVDHNGTLWIATGRGGVARIADMAAKRPHFVSYTTAHGLASNQATCLIEDLQGRIYIGTPNGIDRLDPVSGLIKHFTMADGLANNFVNVAYRDRQGALWFGTLHGISRLLAEADSKPAGPPSILVSRLRIAGEEYSISPLGQSEIAAPELSANQNDLQIDFSSISVGGAGSLRYSYKLEGVDSDWSPPTAQRSITYARLSPGAYRFLVRAINVDGIASEHPALVSFRILAPVWQRWWFLSLAGLSLIGLAYVIHRYRVNRLLELERVRTRIATDLHDDIGASLSQIAILSEVVRQKLGHDHEAVTEPLSQITTSSSELMGTMSDIVWAIDPHKDRLTDLTQRMRRFASDLLTARNIDFEFNAPDASRNLNLGADVRRQIFLVCKESINNIVQHSVCSRVNIDFRVNRDWLILVIRDNGQGFDTAQEGNGHGLASMTQRAKEMGGTLEITSQPGKGTTVTLRMPIDGRPGARFS